MWEPLLFIRLVSWLPNQRDPKTTDVYTTYVINVQIGNSSISWRLLRRYSEFQQLSKKVAKCAPPEAISAMLNRFPFDRFSSWISGVDDQLRNERCSKLSLWIDEICKTPCLIGIPAVHELVSQFVEAEPMLVQIPDAAFMEVSGDTVRQKLAMRRRSSKS